MIQADATSTTVTTAPDTLADFGQSVTFTATVENISDSADPATPTGTAQFTVDGSPYGTPVDLVHGVASISDADLPVGSHTISAASTPVSRGLRCRQFPGAHTPRDPGGSDVYHRVVITQPAYVAFSGESVIFSATLENISDSADPKTPTGTVQFTVDGSPYGSPITLANGLATISNVNLPLGSHSISAAYTPDGPDFAASSSQVPAPLVVKATVKKVTTLEAVSGDGVYSGMATLTATLTSGGTPVAGKTISFTLNEGGIMTAVGTATTNASGVAIAQRCRIWSDSTSGPHRRHRRGQLRGDS